MKIEELIDRYFEGQTSCEEERELRSFFTQENVPIVTSIPSLVCLPGSGSKSIPARKCSCAKSLPSAVALFTQREEIVFPEFISDRHCRYAAIPSPHSGKLRHYRRQAIHG